MKQNLKQEEIYFINNLWEGMLSFLMNSECFADLNTFEKGNKIISKICEWKETYLMQSEKITLYGVDGWYLNIFTGDYSCPNDRENFVNYLYKIMLINWTMDFDQDEWERYKKIPLEEELKYEFIYPVERCINLSKEEFIEELEERYEKSYYRFQYCKSNNPKVISRLELEYPKCVSYIDFLKSNLNDIRIVRVNDFGHDEDVWYFVEEQRKIHLILIQDFM